MTLNDEQLEKVQELSSALLPPAEIAILLELPADDRELFVDMCRNHSTAMCMPPITVDGCKPNMSSGRLLSS